MFTTKNIVSTLFVNSLNKLSESSLINICWAMNNLGFCIIETKEDINIPSFKSLENYFGNIVKHSRSKRNGIVTIKEIPNMPNYLATTNQSHPPHTDGVYLDNPPKFVAMLCVSQSEIGGESIIIRGRDVYMHMLKAFGQSFFKSGIQFTLRRAEQESTHSIFQQSLDAMYLFYRDDKTAPIRIINNYELLMFLEFQKFIINPTNQIVFKLKKNQILILNNFSVLHGRKEYLDVENKHKRCMYRLWFDGQNEFASKINLGFTF